MGALLADLGVSSFHLDSPDRGFSFRADGPLDMRLDRTEPGPRAVDLVRDLDEQELATLLRRLGDETHARRIARAIVERRRRRPVTRTLELARLVEEAVPRRGAPPRRHPATRTFQALRMAVNRELEGLDGLVADGVSALAPRGRLAVISFHGGEDRVIKHALRDLSGRCTCPPQQARCTCGRVKTVEILTKKPVVPSEEEVRENPRSRSARLRAAERVAPAAAGSGR